MDDVTASLAAIEASLERLRRRVLLDALMPGIDSARVRSVLAEVGLPPSEQLEALYAWRDGTSTAGIGSLDDIHFFPGFYLLSVEDAAANYRAFVTDRRWTPGWLPLFANGGGDFYIMEMAGESGVVRHFRIDESEHPVEFLTLHDMLMTIAAGFQRGVFFVDAHGYLEMDDGMFAAMAAELNPRVPWWVD